MPAANQIPGLHHVTAITADPQQNIDFYCDVLGLRLIKLTVNFDDPGSYHLYYGDEAGRPGTIVTFFAWPDAYRGRIGPPQVTAISFAVPQTALDYWVDRLKRRNANPQNIVERFGERVVAFADPDGLQLEIVALANPIPADYAIRGLHSVTISEEGYERTAELLTEVMGFQSIGNESNRFRYRAGTGSDLASTLDLLCVPDARRGNLGAGVVHHVAFRTPDDSQQAIWRKELVGRGLNVSPVMDRKYFHSIYYREPGGVLFEIATAGPGFAIDESLDRLGTKLMLPPLLEPHRAQLEQLLPPINLPTQKN